MFQLKHPAVFPSTAPIRSPLPDLFTTINRQIASSAQRRRMQANIARNRRKRQKHARRCDRSETKKKFN